jgi:hypothetical protein
VLAPYTALVGIVASTASAHEALRWWLFGVAAALIPTSLIITYYRNRTAPHRRVPLAEILSALFAFAAWGLVMPGSPLSLDISGDDLTIATAILAIGGAFLVTLLVPSLNKKSKAAGA